MSPPPHHHTIISLFEPQSEQQNCGWFLQRLRQRSGACPLVAGTNVPGWRGTNGVSVSLVSADMGKATAWWATCGPLNFLISVDELEEIFLEVIQS